MFFRFVPLVLTSNGSGPGAFTKGPFLSSDAFSFTLGAAEAVAGATAIATTASTIENVHPPREITNTTLPLCESFRKASG